jgi:solute carrier family 25 oxoglutarate transporter 11
MAKVEKTSWQKTIDFIQPFWIGGLSGMIATCVIQPVDMIKIVIQLKSEELHKLQGTTQKANFFSAATDISRKEGIRGFYRGYSPSDLASTLPSRARSSILPRAWGFTRPSLRNSRPVTSRKG